MSGKNNRAAAENRVLQAETERDASPCLVVGIGLADGGLEPLEQIFLTMPWECSVAFIVVMHLPAQAPGFLGEILSRYTNMQVLMAADGVPLAGDRVYLVPGGTDAAVREGSLHLEERDALAPLHPIDRLFASLAEDLGERGVAVILSGSGTDGAEGAAKLRAAGGTVIVQSPDSALSPFMPRSAAEVAHHVLTVEEIPARITAIARSRCSVSDACRTESLEEALQALFHVVKRVTGHDFSSYKRNTVIRRIERRMAVNDVAGVAKYVALLQKNPREAQALAEDILIGVTGFFRDPDAFGVLERTVIPRIVERHDSSSPIRIWHPSCATGEEVYSTAMLFQEYLESQGAGIRLQFFATDIDDAAIAQARAGLYSDEAVAAVGERRLKRFFSRSDGRWRVAKELREMVVFAHHSLIKDPPFSRLDLLVCRNFLIYLNSDMQKRLIPLFHQVIRPHGFLFLGAAESVGRHGDLFATVDKRWKIFQRLETGRRDIVFPFSPPPRRLSRPEPLPQQVEASADAPAVAAEKILVQRFSPPCVLVNEKYEVVHISCSADHFLKVPVG
ncbi:MAG TPA: CheR family methyltransferase, partial [Verrucomicrobiae bacterium]|nr:CheR family methyltransferase [Verrucomicrobiae bacterium]